jgi:uncharacterized protein (DUF1330 family)
MPAYIVASVEILDEDGFARFREMLPAVVAKHGGRYLVRGAEPEKLEGDLGLRSLWILEFPTTEAARRFFDSQDNVALLDLWLSCTRSDVALVEGVPAA